MHFLLFYEKVPDHAERQAPLQAVHLEYVKNAAIHGDLVMAGSLGSPDDGSAVLLFESESSVSAEDFAAADPYVTGGIISRWWVRAWDTVVLKPHRNAE